MNSFGILHGVLKRYNTNLVQKETILILVDDRDMLYRGLAYVVYLFKKVG